LHQVAQGGNQRQVFQHVGMVAGMEGVAITEHDGMVPGCLQLGYTKGQKRLEYKALQRLTAPRQMKRIAHPPHLRGSLSRGAPTVEKGLTNHPLHRKTHENVQRKTR
jgi:hypothetical protein